MASTLFERRTCGFCSVVIELPYDPRARYRPASAKLPPGWAAVVVPVARTPPKRKKPVKEGICAPTITPKRHEICARCARALTSYVILCKAKKAST